MIRAKIVDINRYFRTGGINWSNLKKNFDGCVICAGVGVRKDVLLDEHVEKSLEYGVPYTTYHIPDPLQNMVEQAYFYHELPGTKQHKRFGDWEIPYSGSREPTAAEFYSYLCKLEELDDDQPGIYSRMEILVRMGLPSWLKKYKLWLGQYLWDEKKYPLHVKYRYYDDFLAQREYVLPPSVIGTGMESSTVGWQLTDAADAQSYCANRLTNDPVNVYGMTNVSLSLSCIEKDEFMKWFVGDQIVVDPVDNKLCELLDYIINLLVNLKKSRGC